MIKSRLLWVGRENRRAPETVLCERYLTRIQPFFKMDQLVIRGHQESKPEAAVKKEGERILAALESSDFVIACDERGNLVSSPQLADLIQKRELSGGRLVWLIGGAYGLAPALRQRADFMLSLSPMTLPHALARALLLEQIYRACCIRSGHPYHHEG